jgi:hypothetical protein
MKLEFSRQTFEEYSNIKSHENPSSGSRVVPCNKTDSHNESNSRVSQFLRTRQKLEITFVSKLGRFWHCWYAFGDVSFQVENFEARVVLIVVVVAIVKVTFKLSFARVT